ncbi:exopolysaccharide biosynthesis polyprenyl glycosylphosphotransferase [Candidatus Wolfebacteria bacterium]|nr:exopolysaccharide biosynthesis polyprenyl glycosylphosphotransferase [Candidatus Wolfebacteria bacterium]
MWQKRLKIFILFASDILIFYISLALALVIRYLVIDRAPGTFLSSIHLHLTAFSIIFIFWLIIFWAAGLYEITKLRNEELFYKTLLTAFFLNAALAVSFFYFIPYFVITPKINLFMDLFITIGLLYFWRQYFNKWARGAFKTRVVFLGASPEIMELKEFLNRNPQLGYEVAGVLAPDNIPELENLWQAKKFSIIVSAEEFDHSKKLALLLFQYFKKGVLISDLDKFYENITSRVPMSIIREVWFLENISKIEKEGYKTAKRIFDVALGIVLGIAAIAIFPIIFIGTKIFNPGPVFYKQKRVGKNGRIFTLIKFRSLPAGNKFNQMQKPDIEKITPFGRFLRKSHLDELPQVWNILNGEMSFIGPRPEKPNFVERLSDEIPFYEMRHLVKPGIAGWAQLHNPSAGPSFKETMEKLQYDLYYVKNRSVFLDLSIALKTLRVLISGAGK